jgi:hypothetical protein
LRGSDAPLVKGAPPGGATCAAYRALAGQLSNVRNEPAIAAVVRPPPPRGGHIDVMPPVVLKRFTGKLNAPIVPVVPKGPSVPLPPIKPGK